MNQTRILILRGKFNFQIYLFRGTAVWFTKCLYIDWTVKAPSLVRDHLIQSCWLSNCTDAIFATKSVH